MTFNELKKNLKKDFTGLKKINLALLGDSATQFLAQAIRGYGFECQYDINIYDADFNQIERQILDLNAELYVFRPEITVIFESGHKLLQKFNKIDKNQRILFAENHLNRIIHLSDAFKKC